ncbi:MAG TPA: hypothetical protein PLT85_15005, partial [Thauera aminoaromatica]|nr:hypothetical protein [Thauera aminoaromatica]
MSTGALAWVWSIELEPSQKLIALAIADAMNHDGECWIGHERLAVLTGLSARHVRRTLPDLCAASGLLVDLGRRGDGGSARAHYRLPPDVLAALDDWRLRLRDLRAGKAAAMPIQPPPVDTMSRGGEDTVSTPPRTPCPGGEDTVSTSPPDTASTPTRARARRARGSVNTLLKAADAREPAREPARDENGKIPAAAGMPPAWKEEALTTPALLTPVQRAAVVRQLQRAALDADAAQTVLDVLAHRLALARDHGTGTPPEPVSYTRGLLRRLAAGTLDDTDALPIRAARAAAERAERAAAASAASTA